MNYCPFSLDCVWSVLVQWLIVSETQQISFLFLPSLSNFTSSLYLWLLLLLDFFPFYSFLFIFLSSVFLFCFLSSLHLCLLFFPFLFVSVFIHSSFMLPFFCPSFADLKYSTAVFPFFLTLSVPHLLSWTSFSFTVITIFAFIHFLCFLIFSILRQNSSSCHLFTFCCVSFLSSLPSALSFVSRFPFHLFLSSLLSHLLSHSC